jgi:hypothetical protein
MNFELLPILTDYANLLKSSSLCLYSSNLGTFWLKIEQFWPFEEISIFRGDEILIVHCCFSVSQNELKF